MEEKLKKLKEILSSEEIAAKVEASKDIPALVQLLAENGLNLTADELGEILKSIAGADGELKEDDLENAAGGVGLFCVYKTLMQSIVLWKRYRYR